MSAKDRNMNLEAFQLQQLKVLLKEISSSNNFYRHKFEKSGFKISEHEGCEELKDLLGKLPFTEKSELQEDQEKNPPYGTNLTSDPGDYIRIHRTSGTTGKPVSKKS